MPKFQVGDRVRVIAPDSYIHRMEGIIREIKPSDKFEYYIQDSMAGNIWGVQGFELVKIES